MGHEVWFVWAYDSWAPCDAARAAMRKRWGMRLIEHPCSLGDRVREGILRRLVAKCGYSYRKDDLLPWGLVKRLKLIAKLHRFDVVVANYYILSGAFQAFPGSRKIVYTHDVFSARRERTGGHWMTTSAREEGAALNRADHVLSIQESESTFLRMITKTAVTTCWTPVRSISNPALPDSQNILFLGGDLQWNSDAIRKFANEVCLEVSARNRAFRLVIGGSVCGGLEDLARHPFVDLVGRVDSLDAFYSRGWICVNPVSVGTGLKIKSIEAIARGKTLVCHPHAAEAMPDLDQAPVYTFESSVQAVQMICDLLKDGNARERETMALEWAASLNRRCEEAFARAVSGL